MNTASENVRPAGPDLKKNFICKFVYELVLLAAPLVTAPYVSRVLGAEGIGEYSFLYSVITYFMMFSSLGISGYGTREIARSRDDRGGYSRLFWEIRLTGMLPGAACLALWIVIICLNADSRLLLIALMPFLLGTLFDISWFYLGLEKILGILLAGAAMRVLGVVLMFLLVKESGDVAVYTAINACIVLASSLCMWLFLPRQLARSSLRGIPYGKHLREMFVYFIPTAAVSVYLVLDKTLIGVITRDPYQNGYYEQADRIISVAKIFTFGVLSTVATARMSYLFSRDKQKETRDATARSMDVIFFLGYGAAFGLLGITHNLIPVFFGPGYEPAEILLYLMLPLLLIISVSNCLESHYYIPSGKRAQSNKYIIIGAVLNLALNLCLIPFLGAKGAVIASIAAELLITALFLRHCGGCLTAGMLGALSVKRLAAGLIMAAAVRLLGCLPLNPVVLLFVQLLCGAALYILMLLLFRDSLVVKYAKSFRKTPR